MKTWVKVLLAIFVIFLGSLGIVGLAFPEHLPFLRETIVGLFGGIAVGLGGFFSGIWLSLEPIVMPNLAVFWVGSLIVFGVFMMYLGKTITTKMQNFIGVQWRRQANVASGGVVPLTIGGATQQVPLATGTPPASALLGTAQPQLEEKK